MNKFLFMWFVKRFFFLIWIPACQLCEAGSQEETIQCLNSMPQRDLSLNSKVLDYLDKHRVYVSLSTSPKNLPKIVSMLKTLDLKYVHRIYVALPKKYRNQEEYGPIPEAVRNFPKLEIITTQDKEDLGPIMKMLAAIERVGKIDPDAIIISVDDDTGFPKGMIGELIYYSVLYPDAVISGAGNYASFFGILEEDWPNKSSEKRVPYCGSGEWSYCDTVEGWMSIAYKPRLVNISRLKQITALSKACKTSDDLVISYVLAESGVDKIRITNAYFQNIHRFSFEQDEGALHRIKLDTPGWSPRTSVDSIFSNNTNSTRYQRCVHDIKQAERK